MKHAAKAQGIAALGRGRDTELVHMTKGEVAGMHALAQRHGGQLTVNPKTGLVEAGFLEAILPVILGGVTMATTGSPWGAALAGGLGGYATSGGKLSGVFTGALGGYGGAGLYSGIAGLGAAAIPEAGALAQLGMPGAANVSSSLGVGADLTGAGLTPPQGVLGPNPWGAVQGSTGAVGAATPPPDTSMFAGSEHAANAQPMMNASPINADRAVQTATQAPTFPQREWGASVTAKGSPDFGDGFSKFASDPSSLYKNVDGTWNKDALKNTGMAAAPLLSYMMEPNTLNGATTGANGSGRRGMIRPYEFSQTRNPNWAQGNNQPYFDQRYTAGNPYMAAHGGVVPGMAGGGIASLGHYSDGGQLLRGPGDGLSDDIPAHINGKQPAALADGEFVVPADTVSALGGGSTEAGAKKLYGMLDRVRKQAHGTTKQIRPVSAKVLPA